VENTYKIFIFTTLVAMCLTMLFTLIPLWQLVVIPGIVAGFFNKQLKYAILSGLIGVTISWLIYIIAALITRNTYVILEQIGALFLGTGFGSLILMLVIFVGLIIGTIGGGIGYCISVIFKPFFEKRVKE
jgi:uncharacterized membrane protein SpoIIM required for sporulation